MTKIVPWIIATVLAGIGLAVPLLGPKYFGLSAQDNAVLSGALGGAMIGAAGSLFALLIIDWRQSVAAGERQKVRLTNTKKLVVAELVSIAVGLIDAKRLMDAAVRTIEAGGGVPEQMDLTKSMPRGMPLTERLGSDLLIFDERIIDALVTLRSNMERTREDIAEVTEGRQLFGLLAAERIRSAIAHDMTIAAECFELLAPDRKFQFRSQPTPELASQILRQYAKC